MSIENFYPYAGNHAVQSATFVVEWAEPLKAEAIAAVNKLANKFKNLGLSHVQHQQFMQFKVEHNPLEGSPKHGTQHGLGGIIFARPAEPGDVTRSVTISRQNCMVAVPDYTRWDTVFADVQAYLKVALDEIAPSRPLSTIGLQYNDIFQWKDDPADLDLTEVFARDAFIPPSIFNQAGLWHLHQGYLEQHDSPVAHSRLTNVNVDMLDPSGERMIQIIGSHRATLKEPLWQSHLKNKQIMLDVFTSLHHANKQMLAKLLTKKVCEKIRLISE
jgi:uncharacterized protein (TIGR04255 family)